MIDDGDKIVVGVSGGKDSLVLFEALKRYRRFSPQHFELIGVHVDMGFKNADEKGLEAVKRYFDESGVQLIVEKTDIAEILFDVRKESNPCSLCSKMRRGALCNAAVNLGASKLALGHHADDVLDTMLLSFMFEGRLSTLAPKSLMSRTGVTVIRPLIYLSECDVAGAAKKLELPVLFNPCPEDKHTQREYMKKLVDNIRKDIPCAKERMISAIESPERYNLWAKRTED